MRYDDGMESVTFFPILLSGIVSVFLGFVWFHPRVFGGVWMRLAAVSPESVEKGKRRMPLYTFFALLAGMLVAYVMNYFGIAWQVYDMIGAVELGFWTWIGFVAPTMLGMVLWEQRPLRLYLINALYWLVTFIAIAVVLLVL